jgi:hypothetical protein
MDRTPPGVLPFGLLIIMLLAVLFSCAGCSILESKNVQRSGLRCTGDMGTTILLEEVEEVQADKVKEIAQKVLDFVQSGDLGVLPIEEVAEKLTALIPGKYSEILQDLLGAIKPSDDINLEVAIGEDNVRRLVAFLKGVITGADEFREEDSTSCDPTLFPLQQQGTPLVREVIL